MEKFIKWSCFITSGCVVIVFIFALYIGTLLPDTFLVTAGGDIAIAGMPFVRAAAAASTGEVAGLSGGSSYNADLTIAGIVPVKTVRAQVVERRVVQVCGTPFGIKMFANGRDGSRLQRYLHVHGVSESGQNGRPAHGRRYYLHRGEGHQNK